MKECQVSRYLKDLGICKNCNKYSECKEAHKDIVACSDFE